VSRKFKFNQNWTIITGTLREHPNTYIHLWWRLPEFFFERKMFQTKFAEKSKHTFYV